MFLTTAPAPPPTVAVVATPAPADPGAGDPHARATAALEDVVPERWRNSVPLHIEVIGGSTSWAIPGGIVRVGAAQMDTWRHARYVLAHEWAHQAAFRYGTGAYLGAAPSGFPAGAHNPAEQWGECAAQVLVGYRWPSSYPECPADAMQWTSSWLAAGPPR